MRTLFLVIPWTKGGLKSIFKIKTEDWKTIYLTIKRHFYIFKGILTIKSTSGRILHIRSKSLYLPFTNSSTVKRKAHRSLCGSTTPDEDRKYIIFTWIIWTSRHNPLLSLLYPQTFPKDKASVRFLYFCPLWNDMLGLFMTQSSRKTRGNLRHISSGRARLLNSGELTAGAWPSEHCYMANRFICNSFLQSARAIDSREALGVGTYS